MLIRNKKNIFEANQDGDLLYEIGDTVYDILADLICQVMDTKTKVSGDGVLTTTVKADTTLVDKLRQMLTVGEEIETKPFSFMTKPFVIKLNRDYSISIAHDEFNDIFEDVKRLLVAKNKWTFGCLIDTHNKCFLDIDTHTPVDLTLHGDLFTRSARY